MRYVNFSPDGRKRMLGIQRDSTIESLGDATLEQLLASGIDLVGFADRHASAGPTFHVDEVTWLPPLTRPGKIICVGLNYADHTKESPYEQPSYPTLFPRFTTSLIGHGAAMIRPRVSDSLDFEGELAVVLRSGGRHVPKSRALECVAGYSVFNDGSVREYQFKAPQWTVGKNFDGTARRQFVGGRCRAAAGNAAERQGGAVGEHERHAVRCRDADRDRQRGDHAGSGRCDRQWHAGRHRLGARPEADHARR